MCAAPEISRQMHNRPLPVPTPPPQASHGTIPDSVGLFQPLLATRAKSWAPSSQFMGISPGLEAFSALWGFSLPLSAFAHIPTSTKPSPETYFLCGKVLLCRSLDAP